MLIMPGNFFFFIFHYMFVEKPVSSASLQQTGLMPRQLLVASLLLFILNGKICDYQGELCNLKGKFLAKHVHVSFPF